MSLETREKDVSNINASSFAPSSSLALFLLPRYSFHYMQSHLLGFAHLHPHVPQEALCYAAHQKSNIVLRLWRRWVMCGSAAAPPPPPHQTRRQEGDGNYRKLRSNLSRHNSASKTHKHAVHIESLCGHSLAIIFTCAHQLACEENMNFYEFLSFYLAFIM